MISYANFISAAISVCSFLRTVVWELDPFLATGSKQKNPAKSRGLKKLNSLKRDQAWRRLLAAINPKPPSPTKANVVGSGVA